MKREEQHEELETSKMFFLLPLKRMLLLMDQLNLEDHEIIMSAAPFSHEWISAFRRREGRFNLMDFRLNFEIGNSAALKDGSQEAHVDVAEDLFNRGWIDRKRLELARAGKHSEDYNLALSRFEQNKKELDEQLSKYRQNGIHIHDDGSVSLVPEKSVFH